MTPGVGSGGQIITSEACTTTFLWDGQWLWPQSLAPADCQRCRPMILSPPPPDGPATLPAASFLCLRRQRVHSLTSPFARPPLQHPIPCDTFIISPDLMQNNPVPITPQILSLYLYRTQLRRVREAAACGSVPARWTDTPGGQTPSVVWSPASLSSASGGVPGAVCGIQSLCHPCSSGL